MSKFRGQTEPIVFEYDVDTMVIEDNEYMGKYGFYIHMVRDEHHNGCDAHTHGLEKTFNHVELGCRMSLSRETYSDIFHNIVDLIREGKEFSHKSIIGGESAVLSNGYTILCLEEVDSFNNPILMLYMENNSRTGYMVYNDKGILTNTIAKEDIEKL